MRVLFLLCLFVLTGSCNSRETINADEFFQHKMIDWNYTLTNVIISDIFTPPVASRIYAYCNIAAYEASQNGFPDLQSLGNHLNQLPAIPDPENPTIIHYPLSGCVAFGTVAKKLVFGSDKIELYQKQLLEEVENTDLDQEVIAASIEYGEIVGAFIIDWATKDGYRERQAMQRYVLSKEPGKWQPTPPDFMQGIEPNWHVLRPFSLDSAKQFCPPPPTKYDTAKNSQFYREALEVYFAVKDSDPEKIDKANFWDCNPNISHTRGHAMYFTQKISPGGHWLSIAGIAAKKANLPFEKTCETYTLTSIALADAFISCWVEKYQSQSVRPISFIHQYIDPTWEPVLQTPAFPEYTSGHSVISSAAATVLTSLLGEPFSFTDSTEVRFGLPARAFNSFYHASGEAAESRLYGGIHFRPAIENGIEQGKKIGTQVMIRAKTKVTDDLITQNSISSK